jgi:hypothetical protein
MRANARLRDAIFLLCMMFAPGCPSCSSDHHSPKGSDGGCDDGACMSDAGLDSGQSLVDAAAGNDAASPDAGMPADAATNDAGDAMAGADAGPVPDSGLGDAAASDSGADAEPPPCVPTTEVCNGVDDDCDGIADEGMLTMSEDHTLRWMLPDNPSLQNDQRAFAQLLARDASSSWFLYKPLALSDGASGIRVGVLNNDGAQVGATQDNLLPTGRVFIAASESNYVAILWRDTDADDDASIADLASTSTTLTLFEATGQALNEVASLDIGGPSDISEIELQRASGELRIVIAYAPWSISNDTATLTPTVVQTVRYDATSDANKLQIVATQQLPDNARPTVHVVKRPCGTGWILAYWTNNGQKTPQERKIYIVPMTWDGELDLNATPLFELDARGVQGFAAAEECHGHTSPLVLLADSPAPKDPGDPAQTVDAYELSLDRNSNAITQVDMTNVTSAFAFTHIARYGGEWYLTLRNFDLTPTGVFELDIKGHNVRDIATPIAQGGLSAAKLTADVNMYFIPTQAIIPAGHGMLVTFSNARPETSPLGAQTLAVTHRLACP